MLHTESDEQARVWLDPSQIPYHVGQFEKPYRSTVHLSRFLERIHPAGHDALDIGCGAGANIYHLSGALPGFRWVGVDLAGEMLFPLGRPRLAARGIDAELVTGDLYALDTIFGDRRFDLVLSAQTLSWLPDYEPALDQALAATRGWLVISSLFSDFDSDLAVEASDHTIVPELPPYRIHVIGLPGFRRYCEARGCREFVTEDFEIDTDLPRPERNGLGTYTRRLDDGRRLQFTGSLFQPWKFVGIRMGEPA